MYSRTLALALFLSAAAVRAHPEAHLNVANEILAARGLVARQATVDSSAAAAAATSAAAAASSVAPVVAPSSSAAAAATTGAATSSTASRALSEIISSINGTGCTTTCSAFLNDLTVCANGATQLAIATCACSSTTLGDLRTCASCLSLDSALTTVSSSAIVADYNSFVDQCSSAGLATVTGTVAVGASTAAAASRTSVGTSVPSTTLTGTVAGLTSAAATSKSAAGTVAPLRWEKQAGAALAVLVTIAAGGLFAL